MRALFTILVLFVVGVLSGCGSDPASPSDAPPDHTVRRDGVAHMPGLQSPEANCASCHGSDLRGGPEGEPSCFSCHGRVW